MAVEAVAGQAVSPSFYPSMNGFCCTPANASTARPRPVTVGPVFDLTKTDVPLCFFDEVQRRYEFGTKYNLDAEQTAPPPSIASDQYVYPTLSRNEYVRLTTLWYHTQGLNEDVDFLARLEQIVCILKDSLSWELGIAGLLDNDIYIRLATANLPLALLPRRESTCSHTVNMHPGTVFSISDMSQDWRFKNSPHVLYGGIKSYAGTQLRVSLQNGEEVALGSLCIAANTVQAPLTDEQKQVLIRTSDLIAAEIVSRTRFKRLQARETMLEQMAWLRTQNASDPVATALEAVRKIYPDCFVQLETIQDGMIHIRDGSAIISYAEIRGGLYENSARIQENLQFLGADLEWTVRSIIGELGWKQQVLVVASKKLRFVFDDLDAWFVERCAQFITLALKEEALNKALTAKDVLLRSITHDLRTPIHGVLSSAELLSEAFNSAKDILQEGGQRTTCDDPAFSDCLASIRNSATELMITVNSILRYNSLTEAGIGLRPMVYDLLDLEDDVLGNLFETKSPRCFHRLSVTFDTDRLNQSQVYVNANLLTELLKSLLTVAMDALKEGSIVICLTQKSEQHSITFEVRSTSIEAGPPHRDPEAFRPLGAKGCLTQALDLTLSLAEAMAFKLESTLLYVPAAQENGIQFKFELPIAYSTDVVQRSHHRSTKWNNIPPTFYVAQSSGRSAHLVSHLAAYCERRGLQRSAVPTGALIVTSQSAPFEICFEDIKSIASPQVVIVVMNASISKSYEAGIANELNPHFAFCISGPMFKTKLDIFMHELDTELGERISLSETAESRTQTVSISTSNMVTARAAQLSLLTVQPKGRNLEVLIVDDNDVNLKVLEMYCNKRKYPSVKCRDGTEAVSAYSKFMAKNEKRDLLVLMDLQMPICDGIEACKRIRAIEKAECYARSSIFMVTGQDSVSDRKFSFDAGADDYLVKPVSLKKLDKTIADHFNST